MAERSIFFQQWRDCLREQFLYVVRNQDTNTERTLIQVLHGVGFTDDELAQLRLQATIRAEDMPDDFVPDLDILEQGFDAADDIPAEEVPVSELPSMEELPPPVQLMDPVYFPESQMPVEDEAETDEDEPYEPPADDEDTPKQLSLF